MNFLTMQTTVASLAGDEDYAQFSLINLKLYLNWAQAEIARDLRVNQKLQTVNTLDSIDLSGGIALAADFEQEINVFWNGNRLSRIDYGSFFDAYGGANTLSSADPMYYSLSRTMVSSTPGQRRMVFYPYQTLGRTVPGAGVQVLYLAQPVELVADGDISPLPLITHETICLYALSRCKLQENDVAGYQMIMKDVNLRLQRLSHLADDTDAFSYGIIRDADNSPFLALGDR